MSKSAQTYTADSILADLNSTGECSIRGLGKFKIKERPARQGRNPHTGESIPIAAKKVLTFTSSAAMKKTLNP